MSNLKQRQSIRRGGSSLWPPNADPEWSERPKRPGIYSYRVDLQPLGRFYPTWYRKDRMSIRVPSVMRRRQLGYPTWWDSRHRLRGTPKVLKDARFRSVLNCGRVLGLWLNRCQGNGGTYRGPPYTIARRELVSRARRRLWGRSLRRARKLFMVNRRHSYRPIPTP